MSSDIPMEQVPLKSDTDKPAETDNNETTRTESQKEADAAPEQTPENTPAKGRTGFARFFKKDKKEKLEETKEENGEDKPLTEGEEKGTEAEEIIPKTPKKPVWSTWFERKPKTPKEPKEDDAQPCDPQFGLNMIDRDEHNVNEHIKLNFEDILAEPDTNHSWDCSWRVTHRVFTWTRCFIYKLLALIFAIPFAIVWGVVFALLAVINIWACVPAARALTIPATWLAKAWNFTIRSLFDPLFRSCGLCLGSMSIRRYGINTDHTAEIA